MAVRVVKVGPSGLVEFEEGTGVVTTTSIRFTDADEVMGFPFISGAAGKSPLEILQSGSFSVDSIPNGYYTTFDGTNFGIAFVLDGEVFAATVPVTVSGSL